MKPYLVDSHCHLHFPAYAADLPQVLQNMQERRIAGITIGTALSNSERGIKFAEQYDGIWATVGLHPEHLTSVFQDEQEGGVQEKSLDIERLRTLAKSSKKVVALGETGLDYFRIDEGVDRDKAIADQEKSFLQHLQVGKELDLPIVIHCREALGRLVEIIQDQWNQGFKPRAVVHSFTGTWEEAKPLLDLDLYIAVNGISTFPPRKNQDPNTSINRTIEQLPIEKLLVETDAPYLAPAPYRGKRNEPSYVYHVAEHAAQVRGVNVDEIAARTTENANELFRLGF